MFNRTIKATISILKAAEDSTIWIRTAGSSARSKYHGDIARKADGSVDLSAEMSKHPNALWIVVKAIEADNPNSNGDFFSVEEILKSYLSFEGVPVFTNHENNKVEGAKGKVVQAEWREEEKAVYCVMFIDRDAYPGLCRAIEQGYVTDVSMGTQVDHSTCSVCNNRAVVAEDYCFTPGTPILKSDLSVKNIEDIIVGDELLDAWGIPTKVTKIFKHDVSEKLQVFTSKSILGALSCTGNHPFLIRRRNDYRFVPASALADNERLLSPVPALPISDALFNEVSFEKTEENKLLFSRLLGYYTAEGCINNQDGRPYSIEFAFSSAETHLIEDVRNIAKKVFDLNVDEYFSKSGNGISLRIYSYNLADFIKKHISGIAKNKILSKDIVVLPDAYIAQLLSGYIEGDGHHHIRGSTVIHTASQNLAFQVQNLLLRLGCSASINSFENPGGPTGRDKIFQIFRVSFGRSQAKKLAEKYIFGRKVQASAILPCKQSKLDSVLSDDGKFARHTVYDIEEVDYTGPVYNIETESHSYVANNTSVHNCTHVKTMKGRMLNGTRVFERNYGLKFIEISVVTDGACENCTIQEILDPGDFLGSAHGLQRAAQQIGKRVCLGESTEADEKDFLSLVSQVKILAGHPALLKIAGKAEIEKMNQAMDLIQEVSTTMLGQRQYIDLEFLSKVVEVLADLQHVNDELVDQGYGSVGNPQQAQQPAIPPMPGEAGAPAAQESTPGGANQIMQPTNTGVGKITEPSTANSEKRTLLSLNIKDLHTKAKKIYEEALSNQGGANQVADNGKHLETTRKLASLWTNPSVRNYKTEVCDGEWKVLFGKEDIVGTRNSITVASVEIKDLDQDCRELIASNPTAAAAPLLEAIKRKYAMIKESEKAPTDTAEQQRDTFEKQLETQKPPLHPRTKEEATSTTEKQLDALKGATGRTDNPPKEITEKQIEKGGEGMPEGAKRQDGPRTDTTELQLRDKGIKGNTTPADSGPYSAGVKDQLQQLPEAQLEEWRSADQGHNPTTEITEKQLSEQGEPWGRRLSSKEDAKKAIAATMTAMVKTAKATGATPDELVLCVREFLASPKTAVAASTFINKMVLASGLKQQRETQLKRASFHGPKNTPKGAVEHYLLGSMADCGMQGDVGLKSLEVVAFQKGAYEKISEAIAKGLEETKAPVEASASDFLREAMAETAEETITVLLPKEDVSGSDEATFAKNAFAAAIKIASAEGVTVTKSIHVAKKEGGSVEVSLLGIREAAIPEAFKAHQFGPKGKKPLPKEEGKVNPLTEEEEDEAEAEEASEVSKVAARKEARKQVVAQMPPPDPAAGGMGGAAPGGGGTTMPPPPPGGAPAGAPGVPPVGALSQDVPAETDEEAGANGEALPPGSICPACGSDDVDLKGGDFDCNACGAAGTISVRLEMDTWPGAIEEKTPEHQEEGGMGGGMGEMGGEIPAGLPQVGLAASFKVTPEMVKIAKNAPVGSFCPHCGSGKIKLAAKKGCGSGKCQKCAGEYKVDTFVDVKTNSLWGRIEWTDSHAKLASTKITSKFASKKQALQVALKSKGLVEKFAKANTEGKADIIASLHNEGLLS